LKVETFKWIPIAHKTS